MVVTVTEAPKGFTAAVAAAGVDTNRQPPMLCISQWMEQNRKEKLWVWEGWSRISTVRPSSSSCQQEEASERAHHEPADRGMRAEVCQAGQM